MNHSHRVRMLVAAILLAASSLAYSSSTRLLCSKYADYKIVSPDVLLVKCTLAYSNSASDLELTLYSVGDLSISSVRTEFRTRVLPGWNDWMVIEAVPDQTSAHLLQPGQQYRLVLQDPQAGSKPTAKIDVDTKPIATIEQDGSDLSGRLFAIHGNIALQPSSKITVSAHGFLEPDKPLAAEARITEPVDLAAPDPLRAIDPTHLGSASFKLKRQLYFYSQVAFRVSGLRNALGEMVEPDPKARVKIPPAPASKALSTLYVKGDYAAGTGAKPAWIMEGSLTPKLIPPFAGWQLYPDLEADIGQNSIPNLKYTDTVDLGFSLSRYDAPSMGISQAINLNLIGSQVGFVYETDKELDRDNALGTFNELLRFRHLWEPQEAKKSALLAKAQGSKSNQGFEVKPEDLRSPAFGYQFYPILVGEFGSALKDITATATVGKATIRVPSYAIARIGPQLYAKIELWNASFDVRATARYLAVTENTVRQLPNNSLLLRPLNAWQGYEEANANWNLDSSGHLAINVCYKNGFAPPKFNRVNTVQAGLLLKF
jgi:hypothetical protein